MSDSSDEYQGVGTGTYMVQARVYFHPDDEVVDEEKLARLRKRLKRAVRDVMLGAHEDGLTEFVPFSMYFEAGDVLLVHRAEYERLKELIEEDELDLIAEREQEAARKAEGQ